MIQYLGLSALLVHFISVWYLSWKFQGDWSRLSAHRPLRSTPRLFRNVSGVPWIAPKAQDKMIVTGKLCNEDTGRVEELLPEYERICP